LQNDSALLAVAIKAADDSRPALIRAAENAERQCRDGEVKLANAMAEQARVEAEQRVANAALSNAQARLDRAKRDADRLTVEHSNHGDEAEMELARSEAANAVVALQSELAQANVAIQVAENNRTTLTEQRDEAQNARAAALADLAALQSEHNALVRAMAQRTGDKAIDHIKVAPGYERALAAALGDDADAAIGGDLGRRWAGSETKVASSTKDRLSHYVNAPPEMAARLSMVIVVDNDDGVPLSNGEKIVTRDGKMRRWDGFIAEDDGATISEYLVRVNRLHAINIALPDAETAAQAAEAGLQTLLTALASAQAEMAQLSQTLQSTDVRLRQNLRDSDRTEDALTRLRTATAALADRTALVQQELDAATVDAHAAAHAIAALPDGTRDNQLVHGLTAEGEALRHLLIRSQAELSDLDQRAGQSRERRAVAMAEIRSWQERAGEAERRIAELNKRNAEIATELGSLNGQPDILERAIADAETQRNSVAERLAALQSAELSSEAILKALEAELAIAAEALSSARESRAGAEARAENQELRRVEMGRVSGERFECPPPVLPEKLNFETTDLADTATESNRLDRLKADRERIGPVNLIAADELVTLEEEQAKGVAESAELTLAINQLRGSIGSLNREGRQRLLAAFEAVDRHFRRLFTTLFNGGQAHLALIDSDDPLEAGLEIMAQPPGKKLSSLSLLSGGEQALTAVALIFALFLTNPAPICVLDEVDAPLDDANIERFCDLLDVMVKETDTRYLIVTHNAVTMARMHRLFGVTMIEQGISRLVSVDLGGAEQLLAAE
jgi:chromosome segregation protein